MAGAASHTKLGRKNPLSAGLFNLNSEEALATTIHLRLLCPPVPCISRDLCHCTPCAGRSETSTPTTRCSRHHQQALTAKPPSRNHSGLLITCGRHPCLLHNLPTELPLPVTTRHLQPCHPTATPTTATKLQGNPQHVTTHPQAHQGQRVNNPIPTAPNCLCYCLTDSIMEIKNLSRGILKYFFTVGKMRFL